LSSFVQFDPAKRPAPYRVDAIGFQSYNSVANSAANSAIGALFAWKRPRGEDADAQDALAGLFMAGITAVGP
jgi:hypothetical protein